MPFPPAGPQPGILHFIPPNLCAFEPSKSSSSSSDAVHILLWIGGMFDTLLSVQYPLVIARALPPQWTLMTASLSSAGKSWGVGSISQDAQDMAKIVRYLRAQRPGGKIVIMGHSTGCQDCMEYLVGDDAEQRPPVDGVILQAPVSDREALTDQLPAAHLAEANELALKMCRAGQGKDSLPNRLSKPAFGRMAITAQRWLDVVSPGPYHTGADDYFSSDLPDERIAETFGELPASTPLLILYSGSDENVPPSIDTSKMVGRWIKAVQEGGGEVDVANSGVIQNATHNLNSDSEQVVQDLVGRVVKFLNRLQAAPSVKI